MSEDHQNPSRRSFLLTLGGAATASLVKPAFASGQLLNGNKPPSTIPTLGPSDIQYVGLFRLPADPAGTRFGFSNGALTARTVNGNLQFLIAGASPSGDPVYEISYPGYGTSFASAPVASLIKAWGDIYQGKRLTYRQSGSNVRGLLWYQNELLWTYGDPYNASSTSWDPSVGMSVLKSDGTAAAYGPWRTSEHSQCTRGYMMAVPDWFSSQYVSGMPLSIGAPITSGNQASPWGAAAMAWNPPSPGAPPDPVQSGAVYASERHTVNVTKMILHDIAHPQARDANYKRCGWNVPYNCSGGSSLSPGVPMFQDIDMMSGAAWIDLPDKRGVVFFGQLATKLDGFDYGSDSLPHIWYGADICCHGQSGKPIWQATGPGTPTSVPHLWIYDPADLGSVARGSVKPYSLTPKTVFPVSAISGAALPSHVGVYYWGGAHFDALSRLLFVASNYDDSAANPYEPRPVIRVFYIKH
ncbi:MAG TPA: hypothetical protein VHZ73_07045 [Vicinamibacterales bacterium]|jgi:hypothetical protein|nr:hypothetical protein [Vicinamibacterales bacterium]